MSTRRTERASGLPAPLARAPFGVLRPVDAAAVYARPRQEFQRLTERGVLHRLATGYYAVVPPQAQDRVWLPTLEAAAYGIAAADYGPMGAILMGLSAARLHGAAPRALASAAIAIEKNRSALSLADRDATVQFVRRDTARLKAERVGTDMGTALVTTVEQTLLDLAHRPNLGLMPLEAREAVRVLWVHAADDELDRIAGEQRLRVALKRARGWAGA